MIVNKPQFDTGVLIIGQAVCVRSSGRSVNNSYEWHALITDSNPLQIKVSYYNTNMGDIEESRITIEEVVRGKTEIKMLQPVSNKNKLEE